MIKRWALVTRIVLGGMLIVLSVISISGCDDGDAIPTNPIGVGWKSDGIISEGEYASSKVISENYTLWWNSDSTYIYIGMRATSPTVAGYIGIGFLPQDWTPAMQKMDADAVIAFVVEGKAYAYDTMMTGPIGPHPVDSSNDVDELSGSVEGITTTIEFRRKLNTGDKNDQVLEKGINGIMWAVGFNPTAFGGHSEDGYSEIVIE